MSATTVSNIVASMEALMGQVKELQARAAAVEALAHNRGAVMEVQAHVSAEYERRTWAAISSALSAEERNGLHTHEAVQKMAAELIKLRALAAAAAAPAVGSSAPPAPQAAPPAAPAGAVAELKAAVEAEKKRREESNAKFLEELPEELKKMVAARLLAKEVVGLTLTYYTKAHGAAAVAVLAGIGLVAEVDARGEYYIVAVSMEQMERLKREVMK